MASVPAPCRQGCSVQALPEAEVDSGQGLRGAPRIFAGAAVDFSVLSESPPCGLLTH